MAGPYNLGPGQTQLQIPTHPFLEKTKVIVSNGSGDHGSISMTAGGSATEFDDIPPGTITFEREFGGVLLAVKNTGKVALTVETK